MRITQLKISNYKSLKAVEFVPTPLSVVVGANASGKSNLADCLDFISEIYQFGLEIAVSRKGGYENIAFRRQRRSSQKIAIQIAVEFSEEDLRRSAIREGKKRAGVRVEHSFAFAAQTLDTDAPFKILNEELIIRELNNNKWYTIESIKRSKGDTVDPTEQFSEERPASRKIVLDEWLLDKRSLSFLRESRRAFSPTDLFITYIGSFITGVRRFIRALGSIRVFQISPSKSRELGVPTPGPELDRFGSNLPAVIDRLQKDKTSLTEWAAIMETMRAILPDLSNIEVRYSSSRQLSLFFKESGFGRPWNVAEISDGTIQTLALLVAIFKPGPLALVLEEPENSVHPWIIRHIVDACRQASANKQIILTTHSPIVINSVTPEEVWVIWRENGGSRLNRLPQLDPEFRTLWEAGAVPTFDYIDSGALLQAIPPAPTTSNSLDDIA